LTSWKVKHIEQIVPKFVTVDYDHESTSLAKFGFKKSIHERLLAQ